MYSCISLNFSPIMFQCTSSLFSISYSLFAFLFVYGNIDLKTVYGSSFL